MTPEQYGSEYERHFDVGVRFFVSQGARYDDAVECVQAAWVRGWERRHQLRDPNSLMPWIISIGRNLRMVSLKQQSRFCDDLEGLCRHEDQAIAAATDAKSILEKCDAHGRALLEAYYLEGLSVAEIAAAQNASRGAVRTRLVRARQNARRRSSSDPSSAT